MQNTFTTKFILRRSKSQPGLSIIYCRITVNSSRSEFSIKRNVAENNWLHGKVRGNHEEARTINAYMKQVEAKIFTHYRNMLADEKPITADQLRNAYLGVSTDQHSLLNLVDYHNTSMKEVLEWGTLKNYFTTKKYLEEFIRLKLRVSDIQLRHLTYKFISDFERFLRLHKPVGNAPPMGNNTVMKHIERLRKMINLAVKNEWLLRDPFLKFKAKFIKFDREFLSMEELEKVEAMDMGSTKLAYVKDLFIFGCYTGLTYCDVIGLRTKNLSVSNEDYWITTSRKKTNQSVRIPLLPKALALIKKYSDNPRSVNSGTLFPSLSNQKLNCYLKEVADQCGIDKRMTFHMARHTFATTVTLTNGVPIETVSKMLGHTSIRTTQIYARVIENKVLQDMKALRRVLEKNPRSF